MRENRGRIAFISSRRLLLAGRSTAATAAPIVFAADSRKRETRRLVGRGLEHRC